jgi:tRNA modification GTPase
MQAIADADAVLLVGDISRPLSEQDRELKARVQTFRCFVVLNKADLPCLWSPEEKRDFAGAWPFAEVSAKTMAGIQELRTRILEQILGTAGMGQDGVLVTNLRHCRNLEAADKDLERAIAALRDGLSEEFVLTDLHRGLKNLGEITGETGVEDLLTEIFSRFCVGK